MGGSVHFPDTILESGSPVQASPVLLSADYLTILRCLSASLKTKHCETTATVQLPVELLRMIS